RQTGGGSGKARCRSADEATGPAGGAGTGIRVFRVGAGFELHHRGGSDTARWGNTSGVAAPARDRIPADVGRWSGQEDRFRRLVWFSRPIAQYNEGGQSDGRARKEPARLCVHGSGAAARDRQQGWKSSSCQGNGA